MKTIFIAESETHVRDALRLMIENKTGLQVTGEASHAESLLAQVCTTHPLDALLLEWNLSGIHHQRLIQALQEYCPELQIIVMSVKPEDEQSSKEWDVSGFLSKQLPPEEFISSLVTLLSPGKEPV
jgi:DNA-binding NarL/FixJ family response regulator